MESGAIQSLLDRMRVFEKPPRERTLFDIGARGDFENPTTDLLAFFLDPEADHGFADSVLFALLSCLPESLQPDRLDRCQSQAPIREWTTFSQKRIDLVLQSDRWVLAIENKIYHGLHNDFTHYSEDVKARLANSGDRELLCVLLSPHGTPPGAPGWHGIRYMDFLGHLRAATGSLYEQYGESKWLLFLREFVLHLENLTMTDNRDNDQDQFLLEHLGEIDALVRARNDALGCLRLRLEEGLNNNLADLSLTIFCRQEKWPEGPALRFIPEDWRGDSSIVVYLPSGVPGTVRLQIYIDKRNGDVPADLVSSGFDVNQFNHHQIGRTYHNLRHDFEKMDWSEIEQALSDYMRRLISMEVHWQREDSRDASSL